MRNTTIALALAALLLGCSDDTDHHAADMGADHGASDFTLPPQPDGGKSCGVGIYPCGPYGTNVNNVVANLEFMGYMDPKNFCKAHKSKSMDTSTLRKIAFKDWFTAAAKGCEAQKRGLLWVMVSAGWCGPCQAEVKAPEAQYKSGGVGNRVGILNIVFETDAPNIAPANPTFTKKWIKAFSLDFPVVMDPSFKMGAYFDKSATPFNMLVDTKTMKIYFRTTGASLQTIGTKIGEFFAKK